LTFGVVAEGRELVDGKTVLTNVLYIDDEPMIGSLYRIGRIARKLSRERDQVLFYYKSSTRGSGCGPTFFRKKIDD